MEAKLFQHTTFSNEMSNPSARRNIVAEQELLRDLTEHPPRVVIQKIFLFQRGAALNEYNINQTGDNNTAIVDSFKTSISSQSVSPESREQLMKLVESIMASDLPRDEKTNIVRSANHVTEIVAKEGTWKGTASIVWKGLSEAIENRAGRD